ncbi:MAG: diacylglycerol kinase family protein [Spirochaetes bacterium]|nr:diacylglycerol kinase family protein [Spirochaetota bacterium]
MESCLIVINPNRTPRQIRKLRRLLKPLNPYAIVETKDRQEYLSVVKEFCHSPLQYMIVWGGDGTAHDAINVVMAEGKGQEKAIGFMRGGSGNGIQDSYEIPFRLKAQVEAFVESIQRNYTIAVDLLRTETEQGIEYGQLLGLGFDVRILQRRNSRTFHSGEVKPGFLNYFISSALTILTEPLRDGKEYLLEFEEGKYVLRATRINAEMPFRVLRLSSNAPLIEIGTRPYYGRMFKICPDVVCNNGLMDAYLFNFQNKWDILRDLYYLWNGWHHRINYRFARQEKPIIQHFEMKRATLSSHTSFFYHIDGELRSSSVPLKVEVVPQVLTFIVPGVFYRKFHPFGEEATLIP